MITSSIRLEDGAFSALKKTKPKGMETHRYLHQIVYDEMAVTRGILTSFSYGLEFEGILFPEHCPTGTLKFTEEQVNFPETAFLPIVHRAYLKQVWGSQELHGL